ncbi:Smr/MutS family protein [Adhaeribacter rhizoryzae]|uniref:Smr/MutS family protein n=1 Tax=Adhaeribacter rhizoryzae TaxID=2607907 RepID=A0A5M6DF49_9BACT|nr:Smr/MutS family protein [Adhaeribacter rhizoryzae]KAA5544809.1 Smr/MutS family protein [Adhaeribacter rhizoryzae]
MNIGDRVRLLYGKEEGIITRFLDNNQVEVAIDNEFTIPVLRREVVVVAPEEDKFFGNNAGFAPETIIPRATTGTQPIPASLGIYVALTHQSPELLAVTIINNSDYDLLFTYGEEKEEYKGIINDKLNQKSFKVVSHLHLNDFDKWPSLVLQYLQHRASAKTLLEPGLKRFRFKASSFYKSKKMAPLVKKEAYLFQVDAKPEAVDLKKLQDKLTEPEQSTGENYILKAPSHEIDLHIEKLTNADFSKMSNSEILKLQLNTFQDNLDRALAANMHEIIFIHGTGNGVLRNEIQKLLSRNKNIKYFEDARKEKFGYGATLVRLK